MSAAYDTPSQLERLLRQELALYREVLNLCQKQKEILQTSNPGDLLLLVNEKQQRIAKIEQLEHLAAPFKSQRERELDSWSAADRAKVDPLIRQLQDVLGQIVNLEDESRLLAEEKACAGRDKVHKIQTGKAMLSAYGKAVKNPGAIARYKDKNG